METIPVPARRHYEGCGNPDERDIRPVSSPLKPAVWLTILIATGYTLYGWYASHTGALVLGKNPDSFLRLSKVLQLMTSGGWFDHILHRDNAPYGALLQWTRALDILLLILAKPLTLWLPVRDALYVAAFVLPGILFIMQCSIILLAAQRLGASGNALLLVPLGMVANYFILAEASPLNPDHHLLLTLLTTTALWAAIACYQQPQQSRYALLLALAIAAGLWVAPEFLLGAGILYVFLGLHYARNPEEYRAPLHHTVWLVPALLVPCLFLELNNPLEIRHDSLSIVHLILMLLAACLTTLVINITALDTPTKRLGTFVSGSAGIILVMVMLFPGFEQGPFAHVTPFMKQFFPYNTEGQPLWMHGNLFIETMLLLLAALVLSWPLRRISEMSLVIGMALVFLVASCVQSRWGVYTAPPLVLMLTTGLAHHIKNRRFFAPQQSMATLRIALVLCLLPVLPRVAGNAASYSLSPPSPSMPLQACKEQFFHSLRNGTFEEAMPEGAHNVLMDILLASYLLFFTPYNTVNSISHRNADGFHDGTVIQTSTDMTTVQALLRQRHIDVIALCPWQNALPPKGSLLDKLQHGAPLPNGLERLPSPAAMGKGFLVQVTYPHDRK